MAYTDPNPFKIPRHIVFKNGVNIESIDADKVATYKDSMFQHINATVGGLNFDLPAPKNGAIFAVMCIGNALMVRKPTATNLKSLSVDEGALFASDGNDWKQIL